MKSSQNRSDYIHKCSQTPHDSCAHLAYLPTRAYCKNRNSRITNKSKYLSYQELQTLATVDWFYWSLTFRPPCPRIETSNRFAGLLREARRRARLVVCVCGQTHNTRVIMCDITHTKKSSQLESPDYATPHAPRHHITDRCIPRSNQPKWTPSKIHWRHLMGGIWDIKPRTDQ